MGFLNTLHSQFVGDRKVAGSKLSSGSIAMLAVMTAMLSMAPLDTSQLMLAVLGAIIAAAIQLLGCNQNIRKDKKQVLRGKRMPDPKAAAGQAAEPMGSFASLRRRAMNRASAARQVPQSRAPQPPPPQKVPEIETGVTEVRQISKVPIIAPTFNSSSFDQQVDELLAQIAATPQCEQVVQKLAQCVKNSIKDLLPDADVVGLATGAISRGTAFGVAVPEVDIVASARPHNIVNCLQSHLMRGSTALPRFNERKLQKSAVRACTDVLVSTGGFKFRRSAFRGMEPKVTLMAPPNLGLFHEAIPIDFSVNSVMPLHNMALLTECGQIEPRAKALILLVRRWAKDRGVCHAAKGHLPPYAWTLMAIYFLQVGLKEGSLLPPLQGFKLVTGLTMQHKMGNNIIGKSSKGLTRKEIAQAWVRPEAGSPLAEMHVASLFKKFLTFYLEEVDWRHEAASIRYGKRDPPNLQMELHIVVHPDGCTEVGPCIEDPFEPKRNLASCVTSFGMVRLREELQRATDKLEEGVTLSELIEPWVPPERNACEDEEDDEEKEEKDELKSEGGRKLSKQKQNPFASLESDQAASQLQDALANKLGKAVLEHLNSEVAAELLKKHSTGDKAEKDLREVLQLIASKDADADQ